MKEYKLTIVNGFKAVPLFTLYALIILGSIILSIELKNILWKIVLISGTIILM